MSDNKTPPNTSTEPNSFKTVTEASTTSPASRSTMTTPDSGASASSASSSSAAAGSSKSAGEMLDDTKRAVSDEAASLSAKAKAQASGLVDKAHHMADDKFDEYKSTATGKIEETAEHIRNAGHEFGDDSYQAKAADYLASNLTRAADMVRNQSLSTLTDDLTRFARQNPAVFLGGAALLGFAAARLMKASERNAYGYDHDYGRDRGFDAPPSGTYGTPYDRPGAGRMGSPYGGGTSSGMGGSSGMGTGSSTGMGTSASTGTSSGMGAATGSGSQSGMGTSSGLGTTPGMTDDRKPGGAS